MISNDLHNYLKQFDEICYYQEIQLPPKEKKEYFWRDMSRCQELQETLKSVKLTEAQLDHNSHYEKLRNIAGR